MKKNSKKTKSLAVKKEAQSLGKKFYLQVREVIQKARNKTYHSVNFIMVEAYWNIGRLIVDEEQKGKERADYGKYLILGLAESLMQEFGKGFDERNLRNMRAFYRTFPIRNATRAELSWTHYRMLLKVEKEDARKYYIKEAIVNNWSTRQLERQINSFYYERLLSSKKRVLLRKETNKLEGLAQPEDLIKDPFVLEFLNVKRDAQLQERELESMLIGKLQNFLLELGRGFSFVGRQHRISADTDHFYIDLVFYNYVLKCFVLIDLKTGKLTHQDIGQMDFYVRYFEDKICNKGDNPTIGIVLCSEKNEAIVKYSVLKGNRQLFASKYKLYLPTEEELRKELEHERAVIEREQKLLKCKP
ncbi:MAG: PDDEXK nuclease domain-containing protein [Candidatus Omnitrophota bacterium]